METKLVFQKNNLLIEAGSFKAVQTIWHIILINKKENIKENTIRICYC